jgi:hypothetical protein
LYWQVRTEQTYFLFNSAGMALCGGNFAAPQGNLHGSDTPVMGQPVACPKPKLPILSGSLSGG